MAKDLVERNTMTAIGNAIRSKLNNSTRYKPSEMPGAIASIPEGYPEPAGTINITQNGTQNVKDYASANVNVPNSYAAGDEGKVVSGGALVAQTSGTATQNGTVDTTLINSLLVNVSGGGGGGTTILTGADDPTPAQGADGDIYLKMVAAVAALLHFEDSATTDESGLAWTGNGSPVLSSDQAKFGTKSLYLNGSSYIQSTVTQSFNFGTGDFTIDCWVYPTQATRMAVFAMSSDQRIATDIFFGQGSANLWMSSTGGGWNILQSDSGGGNTGQGTIPLSANQWTHLAYVRNGDNVRMYVNGEVARNAEITPGTAVYFSGNDGMRIGCWGNGGYKYVGYIDEFRVLKGVAAWTAAFTPPTQPYVPPASNVVGNAFIKQNGAWVELIGADISDVITQ